MVACELEQKDVNAFPGVTLFTKRQAPGMKPTAVYLPPKHATAATKFDVVIWLHGFYVRDHEFLFRNDPARLREQVRDSGKDVVLIAPFLGYEYAAGDSFAGGFMGHLAGTGNKTEASLRRAMVYGSVLGSFAVEKFGLDRLRQLKRSKIHTKARHFAKLTQFKL